MIAGHHDVLRTARLEADAVVAVGELQQVHRLVDCLAEGKGLALLQMTAGSISAPTAAVYHGMTVSQPLRHTT